MTITATAVPSLIAALHARYEATQAEYVVIEEAATKANRFDTPASQSELEADTLRLAILTQVPDSWADAAILMFHIRIAHDFQAMATKPDPEAESAKVLSMAIDTVFDFMASEPTDFDHGEVGKAFQQACVAVHFARRHRTGDMI